MADEFISRFGQINSKNLTKWLSKPSAVLLAGIIKFQENLTKMYDNPISRQTESSEFVRFQENLIKTSDKSVCRQTELSDFDRFQENLTKTYDESVNSQMESSDSKKI